MDVSIMQADDPHRAISVQNPMSINDLMVTQQAPAPRRLSTNNIQPSRARRARREIDLPPARPPSPVIEEVDPEEMGYGLI